MEASIKTTVFWDVGPCSLAEIYRRFGGSYASITKAMGGNIPEDSNFHYFSTFCIP
jgi:hypothetical protein